jgi:uncharacterized protein (DUF1778 family)
MSDRRRLLARLEAPPDVQTRIERALTVYDASTE